MTCLSIGGFSIRLDIPPVHLQRLTDFLLPFLSQKSPSDAFGFRVETAPEPIPPGGPAAREQVVYCEHSATEFDLLSPRFRLAVALEKRQCTLRCAAPADDEVSVVYHGLKWFVTYLAMFNGGIPLHSSCIADGDDGYVFSGAPETGKSTIARLLTNDRPDLIRGSDELNLILVGEESVRVAPTPFVSSAGCSRFSGHRRLRHIFFLRHASRHSVDMLDYTQSFRHILKNCHMQAGPRKMGERLLSSIESAAASVPCGILYFNNDRSFAPFFNDYVKAIHEAASQP
jgi:hypothetical protein